MEELYRQVSRMCTRRVAPQTSYVLAQPEAAPIDGVSKEIVIKDWSRVVGRAKNFFLRAWIRAANRSQSMKAVFGIGREQPPESNAAFVKSASGIEGFFLRMIIEYQLEDERVREACIALGAQHIHLIPGGFRSAFWDIFLVCIIEVLDETLKELEPDDTIQRAAQADAWYRVLHYIVTTVRTSYYRFRQLERLHSSAESEERSRMEIKKKPSNQ